MSENKGDSIGNPVDQRISRRRFLLGLGVLFGTGALYEMVNLPPLPEQSERKYDENKYQPGFAEMEMEPAHFISPRYGHIPYIKNLGKTPLIRKITGQVYEEMMTTFENKEPKLGTALAIAGDTAREMVSAQYPQIEASALDEETLHLSAVSLGVLFSNRWETLADLEELIDADLRSRYKDENDFYFGENGINNVILPPVFGRYDRANHAANHLFLAVEYIYLKRHNLKAVSLMPKGLELLINTQKNEYDQAKLLSFCAKYGYEARTTLWPIENLKFWDRKSVQMGYFDLNVGADLMADREGYKIARRSLELLDEGKTWPEIRNYLIEVYDRDEWHQARNNKSDDIVSDDIVNDS